MMDEHIGMWNQQYQPSAVECETFGTLASQACSLLRDRLNGTHVPDILIIGPQGSGKTTLARLLCDDANEVLNYFDAPDIAEGKLDEINFGNVGLSDRERSVLVVIDNVDAVSKTFQTKLCASLESSSEHSCILTATSSSKLIPRLSSLCTTVNTAEANDRERHIDGLTRYFGTILATEGVPPVDQKELRVLVETYYPDLRQVMNELQHRYQVRVCTI